MKLNIKDENLKLFIKDLWKDSRQLKVTTDHGIKVIRRYSDHQTSIDDEYAFLERLQKIVSFRIPTVVTHTNDYISYQYIAGTRASNLLYDLKELFQKETDCQYLEVATKLTAILHQDLAEFQAKVRNDAKLKKLGKNYPVTEKLVNMFCLLTSITSLDKYKIEIIDDLNKIAGIYSLNSKIPFRDATPKNVILDIPALYQEHFKSRNQRLSVVKSMVKSGELANHIIKEKLFHIDFSGSVFLCPLSDDWIALKHHEVTNWLSELSQDHTTGENMVELCTKFVRFARFGGRKLAYRLLNQKGYNIRFILDNEAYYFSHLQAICQSLQNQDFLQNKSLVKVLTSLEQACSYQPTKDHLHSFAQNYQVTVYYQDVFPN